MVLLHEGKVQKNSVEWAWNSLTVYVFFCFQVRVRDSEVLVVREYAHKGISFRGVNFQ